MINFGLCYDNLRLGLIWQDNSHLSSDPTAAEQQKAHWRVKKKRCTGWRNYLIRRFETRSNKYKCSVSYCTQLGQLCHKGQTLEQGKLISQPYVAY